MDVDESGTALVARPAGESRLVGSLDEARSRDLVHVDRYGRVRSPARFRFVQGVGYVCLAALPALPFLYGAVFGPIGAIGGTAYTLWAGLRVRSGFILRRALRSIQSDEFDEAQRTLEDLLDQRGLSRGTRALAHHNLAVCHACRGDHERALEQEQAATREYTRMWTKPIFAHMAAFGEVYALVNLGRANEAVARLAEIDAPEGEYLQLQQWSAELYCCFLVGEHPFSDDELHRRALKGLAMTAGAPLLGLTAWAHIASGDADQGDHLLAEAFDRISESRMPMTMPRLYQWMRHRRTTTPTSE